MNVMWVIILLLLLLYIRLIDWFVAQFFLKGTFFLGITIILLVAGKINPFATGNTTVSG